MSQVQAVVIGFGKANFPDTLATFAVFRVRTPFYRESGVTTGRQIPGAYAEYLAGAHADHGSLYRKTVEHKMGDVIALQASWKRNGSPLRDGAVFLRLRDGATKWKIEAKLPRSQANRIGGEFVVFEGHADILTVDDLDEAGFALPGSWRDKFMSEEEVDECFVFEQLLAERLPRPVLTTVIRDGKETVVEVAPKPLRRMLFRR